MSLTAEQIRQLAQLARLELAPAQIEHYTQQLTDIFAMVGQLAQADTRDVEPLAHPLQMHQRVRTDVVTEPNRRDEFQALAPAVENGLYLVPKVIE